MFHLPEEILRKIYEYDSYKEDNWAHIVSDINTLFLHSIENEIFTIMTTKSSNRRGIRNWYLITPKLETCFGQNLDEFKEEINELILKTWKKDW